MQKVAAMYAATVRSNQFRRQQMRRFGKWSVTLGTCAFAALPLLAAGCAESQSTATDKTMTEETSEDSSNDDLGELAEDLGAPAEAGSGLGFPAESGSGLGFPAESGSGLGLPESGSGLEVPESGSNLE